MSDKGNELVKIGRQIGTNAQSGYDSLKALGELLNAVFRHPPQQMTHGEAETIRNLACVATEYASIARDLSVELKECVTKPKQPNAKEEKVTPIKKDEDSKPADAVSSPGGSQ